MKLKILCVVGATATLASAQRFDLFVYENADDADVSGLDLYFEVFDQGGAIDFVFHNDSTDPGFVSAVYFEDTFSGLTNGHVFDETVGVDFEEGATPHKPAQPGVDFGGAWSGNIFDADAESPSPQNGINAGVDELLTIRFDLDGISFDDVVGALSADPRELRIAQHVQGFVNGQSVWTVNVPAPATLIAFGGLAAIANRRRR